MQHINLARNTGLSAAELSHGGNRVRAELCDIRHSGHESILRARWHNWGRCWHNSCHVDMTFSPPPSCNPFIHSEIGTRSGHVDITRPIFRKVSSRKANTRESCGKKGELCQPTRKSCIFRCLGVDTTSRVMSTAEQLCQRGLGPPVIRGGARGWNRRRGVAGSGWYRLLVTAGYMVGRQKGITACPRSQPPLSTTI